MIKLIDLDGALVHHSETLDGICRCIDTLRNGSMVYPQEVYRYILVDEDRPLSLLFVFVQDGFVSQANAILIEPERPIKMAQRSDVHLPMDNCLASENPLKIEESPENDYSVYIICGKWERYVHTDRIRVK